MSDDPSEGPVSLTHGSDSKRADARAAPSKRKLFLFGITTTILFFVVLEGSSRRNDPVPTGSSDYRALRGLGPPS